MALAQGPELGGIVNLPAIFIIAVVAGLLIYGTKESATVNALLVLVKIVALIVFVAVTLPYFDSGQFRAVHALTASPRPRPRRRRTSG